MKTNMQKEMRKIRVQLKLHDITEKKKESLRKALEKLKISQQEEKENGKDVKNI